jgi:hypothetical protein
MGMPARGVLTAYIHLRPATPEATRELLTESISAYARRHGYALGRVLVGEEARNEHLTVRDLLDEVKRSSASAVLIAGASARALAAVHQLSGVEVVTLDDVSRQLAREHGPGRHRPARAQ